MLDVSLWMGALDVVCWIGVLDVAPWMVLDDLYDCDIWVVWGCGCDLCLRLRAPGGRCRYVYDVVVCMCYMHKLLAW